MIRKGIIAIILVPLLFYLFGCADRIREEAVAPGSTEAADEAVAKAEQLMESAGIAVSFNELGSVADLVKILPDPLEIAQLERSVIEESVSSLYEALDALGDVTEPAAFAPGAVEPSKSDLAMLHLHIGYLYVLEAIRRMMIVRFDDAGFEMYTITYPEEINTEDIKVYDYELSEDLQARFDQLDQDPNADPYDYLRVFREDQRQAFLDALVLLTGVEVNILANAAQGIIAQEPDVDRSIWRRDALYHINRALGYAVTIAPALNTAFEEFKETVQDEFSYGLIQDARKWGFNINEDSLPEDFLGGGQ